MESIFSRLYPYKQTESKGNLENYLIEIFAFCLQNDDTFRNNFLSKFTVKDLTVQIWIPLKDNENDETLTFFKANLGDWDEDPYDDCVIIGNYKTVNEIVAKGQEQIPAMTSFLKKGIDHLAKLKDRSPEIFQ